MALLPKGDREYTSDTNHDLRNRASNSGPVLPLIRIVRGHDDDGARTRLRIMVRKEDTHFEPFDIPVRLPNVRAILVGVEGLAARRVDVVVQVSAGPVRNGHR